MDYESRCKNLHGHNYLIEVWITDKINENGMVADFSDIKKVLDTYDHKYLNDYIQQPTVENLAAHLLIELKQKLNLSGEVRVRIWEDSDSYVEVLMSCD